MAGERYGDFEILDEIGRGGMGVVYRARQVSLDRTVALKVLPLELAQEPKAAERFSREAHNMARLRHPNIVDVISVGEQEGQPYFAMQYVGGESLRKLIAREGPLAPERAAELASQVADALFHAHEQGVIHRDIKPENILIDEHGRAVVTDFGIAKTADGMPLTATGMSIGTPDYMSPELVKGNPIDGRADLYSLGVVLYQMVAGRVPFTATTPVAVAMKHVSDPVQPPSALGANCPEWLESIILRAMAKEPSERFASGAEMAAALRSARPVEAQTMWVPSASEPGPAPASARVDRRAGGTWVVAAGLGLLGISIIVLALAIYAPSLRHSTGDSQKPTAVMPAVLGLTEAQAAQELTDAGLRMVIKDRRYHNTIPTNHVCSCDKNPGDVCELGEDVHIVLSLGRRPGPDSYTGTQIESQPTQASAGMQPPAAHARAEVRSRYWGWLDAWKEKEINRFMGYYSRSVRVKRPGKPLHGYDVLRQRMLDVWDKCGPITISSDDPNITVSGNKLTVRAYHHYDSATYWDKGVKRLDWRQEGNTWKIVYESFSADAGGRKP